MDPAKSRARDRRARLEQEAPRGAIPMQWDGPTYERAKEFGL